MVQGQEFAETRPKFNFPESKAKYRRNVFMAGTGYFAATTQPTTCNLTYRRMSYVVCRGGGGGSVEQWVWSKGVLHFSRVGGGGTFLTNNTQQLFYTSNTLGHPELYFSP